MTTIRCEACGRERAQHRRWQRFCGNACRMRTFQRQRRAERERQRISAFHAALEAYDQRQPREPTEGTA